MNATTQEIREAFAQDLVQAVISLKNAADLPTEEAFVALYAAVGLFEAGAANTGFPVERMKEYQEVGLKVGRDFYQAQLDAEKAAAENASEGEPVEEATEPTTPTLGMGAKLGGSNGKAEPGIVGPGEGSGLVDAQGEKVQSDALTLQGSQAVVAAVGGATMEAMFPLGGRVHMLDALAFITGAQRFIEEQIPKDIKDWEIRKVKLAASGAVGDAIRDRKDGVVHIDNRIFGPGGSRTVAELEEQGTGLVGLDGKEIMKP